MCEPVSLGTMGWLALGTTAAAGTAQAVSGYQQAQAAVDAADAQAEAQAEEYAATRDQQLGERVREARIQRSRMRVAAGEAGIGGQSFELQIQDSLGRQNQDAAVAKKQGGFTQRAINASNKNVGQGFNAISAGLQIASDSYGAGRAAAPRGQTQASRPKSP
jgi:hypothetical protein